MSGGSSQLLAGMLVHRPLTAGFAARTLVLWHVVEQFDQPCSHALPKPHAAASRSHACQGPLSFEGGFFVLHVYIARPFAPCSHFVTFGPERVLLAIFSQTQIYSYETSARLTGPSLMTGL